MACALLGSLRATDSIALCADLPAGADPTASVALTAVNGSAATFMRSDAAPALDVSIAPTWSGTHVFSLEPTFTLGIDLSTSGRIDSNVADAAAAIGVLVKPTTAFTSGQDRAFFAVQDSIGTGRLSIMTDGSVNFGGVTSVVGQLSFSGTPSANVSTLINLNPIANFSSVGTTLGGVANCIAGGVFVGRASSSSSAVRHYGGYFSAFDTLSNTTSLTEIWAGKFKPWRTNATTGALTHTEAGGILISSCVGGTLTTTTVTDYYGIKIEDARSGAGTKPTLTNVHGIRVLEQTKGGTLNMGILLNQATTGYKALCLRDTAAWINSDAANDLDLNAVTSIDFNINTVEEIGLTAGLLTVKDGFDFAYGTSTGSKHGNSTLQKQAFWNATPITQPANTVAINDVLVNTGLRASGGSSNFSSQIALDTGAKVKKEIRIEAAMARKGAAAPGEALRAVGASGTDYMPVITFSKTVQQDIYFTVHTPTDLDASVGASFHLMWQPGAAWTTGNYLWKLEYLAMNENGATLLSGTPTTLSADVTPSNATTNIETEFSGSITLAADQMLVCHLYRDVAGDNADDIGEVSFVEIEYTANKLGEAV